MEAYESSTKPVIDYYDQKGVVTHISILHKTRKYLKILKKLLRKMAKILSWKE